MFSAVVDSSEVLRLAGLAAAVAKNLDAANEGIGRKVIGDAQPGPVVSGSGVGSAPKVVASPFQARIEAGGPHRAQHVPVAQWGAEPVAHEGERPYLVRAAEANVGYVEDEYLDAVANAAMALGFTFIRGI
jgi:hypothetical protein